MDPSPLGFLMDRRNQGWGGGGGLESGRKAIPWKCGVDSF